jgi:hypothetical protein
MVKLPSREATQAELALVHTAEHIQTITDTASMCHHPSRLFFAPLDSMQISALL